MKKHDHVKWSEVARKAIKTQAEKLEIMDKILVNSKLTEEDAIEIGRKINKSAYKRLKESLSKTT
ncbi:hypothetical protein HY636_02460 [Candidatus Woesearchaeota archaeon]|nr:hypothetical protein [Candidatus Woesearchaeota archaeon]